MTTNLVYSKDSFDRFGDDLCQLLLSYLQINDKFRYECVCKQWKRLIFNEQFILILDSEEMLKNSIKISRNDRNNERLFKLLFRKLKCAKQIKSKPLIINNNSVINALVNSCLNIENVNLDGFMNENVLSQFALKFGTKLKSIDLQYFITNSNIINNLLSLTPNLKQLIISYNLDEVLNVYLSKLEDIKFKAILSLGQLKSFTHLYCKQIKRIQLLFDLPPNGHMNKSLILLSEFKNLEYLRIDCRIRYESLDNGLIVIGQECEKLKYFDLSICSYGKFLDKTLSQVLSGFQALEKLVLNIQGSYQIIENYVKDLKNCKNLKYLVLVSEVFKHENLENIDLYLPNLRQFSLTSASSHLTDPNLISLSKLKHLQKLELNFINMSVLGFCRAFGKCPKMNQIAVKWSYAIDHLSVINAFTRLAFNNPQTQYKFTFRSIDQTLSSGIKNTIPCNLMITNFST